MTSNERPSPHGYGRQDNTHFQKKSVNEETLKSEKLQIERKTFILTLKQNPRGKFLRITEDVGGRRDSIIIPATGLTEFRKVFDEMVKASEQAQPPPSDSKSL